MLWSQNITTGFNNKVMKFDIEKVKGQLHYDVVLNSHY